MFLCLCLSVISCKKDSLKTVYAHYEFILDDDEILTGDIGYYGDFILDMKYPIECDIYFSRDTSGNPIFDCAISRAGGHVDAHLAVSNSDSQIFIDGKDYYTDKGEKELMEETDHKHFLSSIYFKERYFSFFEQARYRFDLKMAFAIHFHLNLYTLLNIAFIVRMINSRITLKDGLMSIMLTLKVRDTILI